MRYGPPGGTWSKLKPPLSLAVAVRDEAEPGASSVTVAPGITSPASSLTVPLMLAAVAQTALAPVVRRRRRGSRETDCARAETPAANEHDDENEHSWVLAYVLPSVCLQCQYRLKFSKAHAWHSELPGGWRGPLRRIQLRCVTMVENSRLFSRKDFATLRSRPVALPARQHPGTMK